MISFRVRQAHHERNQLPTIRLEPVEGLIKSTVNYFSFPHKTLQFLAVFPIILVGLLAINGCSSGLNLGIGDQAKAVALYSKSTFGLYDISTFDVYVDDDLIHILVGGKVSKEDKLIKLSYTRSEDGGHNWLMPVILDEFPTTIGTRGNDIQLAAKGNNLLAVWQTKGELPGMGPMVSAYSNDNGLTWTKVTNPAANNAGDQSHLDLIGDQQGLFHAVWLEDPEENGYQSLRYARSFDNGGHWNKATTLDDSTCSCCWNTFALSPKNELNILYRDMKPRDMSLLQSNDDGKTWQHVSTVGEFGWQFDGCPHVGGSLTYTKADNAAQLHSLVWTGVEGKSGLYHLSSPDNGKSWSTPYKLGNAAIHSDIAMYDGNIVAVWDEMEADGTSIFYAKSEDGGTTWQAAIRLTTASNAATHPRLVATKHGLLVLWTEKPYKQPGQLAWFVIE